MSSTETEICNSALIKVGADTIASLTDNSKRARLCNKLYGTCRDEVLYAHPWNFAIKRVQLARLSTSPTYEFTYAYQLPSDVLRVLGTKGSDLYGPTLNWQREGDTIVSDESSMMVRYIAKITDVQKFNSMFKEVLALRIAGDLAYPLTQSNSLTDRLKKEYREWIRESRSFDAQEGNVKRVVASEWRDARY